MVSLGRGISISLRKDIIPANETKQRPHKNKETHQENEEEDGEKDNHQARENEKENNRIQKQWAQAAGVAQLEEALVPDIRSVRVRIPPPAWPSMEYVMSYWSCPTLGIAQFHEKCLAFTSGCCEKKFSEEDVQRIGLKHSHPHSSIPPKIIAGCLVGLPTWGKE